MPKIRGFKADLWTDEDFVELSPYARLLWMGIWNYCCDNGHIADKSKQIKMRVLPTDDVNCAELLRELEANGRIIRKDGIITVPNFTRHQKPDKRYFQICDLPDCVKPDENPERETRGGRTSQPRGSQGTHDEVNGSEVKGSDGEGGAAAKPAKKTGKKPATSLPADWQPTPEHLTRCEQEGIDCIKQAAKFKAHAEANDRHAVNWNAAFTQWLLGVPAWDKGNVTPLHGTVGHFKPFSMPIAPAHIADDPELYARWADERRTAWQNGERW